VLRLLKPKLNSFFLSLIDVVGVDLTKLKNYNLFFHSSAMHLPSATFNKLVIYNTLDYASNSRAIFYCFASPNETFHSTVDSFSNSN
jgi:hypothetical protein